MTERRLTLRDGRTLAFTDIGSPTGRLVVYCHGAPGGRLELTQLDAEFAAVGVRLVTPDRPGYGGSDPMPGRTTAGWTEDVVALTDHLGSDRFGVIGLSSGGPYAVACTALLPERVTGAVIAAGNTDMSWPHAADGYLDSELGIMALGDEDAAVRYCEGHFGADGSRFFDGDVHLGAADDAFLADAANATALMVTMGEAFRQGVVGYAHDITVQGRPWTFDPSTITAPVVVAHGTEDRLVPIAHSRHTADLIPGAELRIIEGCGHLGLLGELPAMAAETVRRSA